MKEKLKGNWKEYLAFGILGVWVLTFVVVFYLSAQAGCTDDGSIFHAYAQGGLCLARRIMGMSCFAGFLGLWAWLGGLAAMAKGRNPVIGWILGFALNFMGGLFILMWEPRRDRFGEMIHWNDYKHLSKEQKEAIRPVRVPDTPADKKRKKIVIAITIAMALLMVFQILRNLGKV